MFPEVSQIKKAAKSIVKEKLILSFIISAVLLSVFLIGQIVSELFFEVFGNICSAVVSVILLLFAELPLLLGAIRYYSQAVEGIKEGINGIFFYFSSKEQYLRAVRFLINSFIVIAFFTVAVMFIPVCLWAFSKPVTYGFLHLSIPLWAPIFSTVSSFLMIIGTVILAFILLKYYLCPYLFVCNDKMDIKKVFKISLSIQRRTKIDFVYLVISMLLYILISLPILPLIFTLPLFLSVYAVHGKCAVIQYNNAIDSVLKDYTVVAK